MRSWLEFWRVYYPALLVFVVFALTPFVSAQLGGRPAQEWIDRLEQPDRVAELKIEEVMAHLHLRAGDVIADIGAGTGVFSRPFAKAVGPDGVVFAVEIDKQLVDHIQLRAQQEGISNLTAILGEFDDPTLPVSNVDLAFFHNVFHHIQHRQLYVQNLVSYLNPDARVVVIDRIGGHQEDPHQHLTLDSVKEWMQASGLSVSKEVDLFEGKYFVIFSRAE